jgi:predicted DNA-binding transcriptional regulator YafY
MHYRDNWYLDAWCHLREGLRAFAVDAIQAAELLDTKAKDIDEKRLDKVLGSGYGIFSGDQVAWATLRFTPGRARWVSTERWHPLQRGKMNKDGSYELKVPFNDHRELVMDILKYGEDCMVISPPELLEKVREQLERGLQQYGAKE